MLRPSCKVRPALPADVPVLIKLMSALAEFEGYLDEFRVTEAELLARAFGEAAQCQVFVAEQEGVLAGYAVVLEVAFTFDLRPTALLKELYIEPRSRGGGIGKALMTCIARWVLSREMGRLKWDVLAGNENAERFYMKLGGEPDRKWTAYHMGHANLERLAKDDCHDTFEKESA
jgi:GNAT superfamily N-acetyltransferase